MTQVMNLVQRILNIALALFLLAGFKIAHAEESKFIGLMNSIKVESDDFKGEVQVVKMEEKFSTGGAISAVYVPYVELRLLEKGSNHVYAVRANNFPVLPSQAQIWFNKDTHPTESETTKDSGKINLYCLPQGLNPAQSPPGEDLRLSADQAATAIHAVAQVTAFPDKKDLYLDRLTKVCDTVLEENAKGTLASGKQQVDLIRLVSNLNAPVKPKKDLDFSTQTNHNPQLAETEMKADTPTARPELSKATHYLSTEAHSTPPESSTGVTSK